MSIDEHAPGAEPQVHAGDVGREGSQVDTIEWLALAAGLLPVVTVCVWALATGWMPLGDSGQLAVRSRDVFTENHPFVGAWSSRSVAIDGNINNLGSLQLVLLAPFTRLDPYWGTALGMTVINSAAVVGVWAAARSVLGRLGAVGAMLATLALIASMGSVPLLETRQQLAMLLPFWCLMWVSAALWSGRSWAAPAVVFFASLVVQTHFTFIYQAVALAAAGTVAFVVGQRARGRRPETLRPLMVAGVTGLVCWAPTLWDQFVGNGNLGKVASQSGSTGDRAGLGVGAELVGDFALRRAFWMPGSMGRSELAPPVVEGSVQVGWASWLTVGAWAALVLATWAWARANGHRGLAALAGVAGVALGSALMAADRIPPLVFRSYGPQNYYWLWPVALLLALAPLAAVATALQGRAAIGRRLVGVVLAVALVTGAVGASLVTNRLGEGSKESFDSQDSARSFVEQFAAGLEAHPIRGPVVVHYRGAGFSAHGYTFLVELQRQGIPFTFEPDDGNLFRFGRRRCADASVRQRITFFAGRASAGEPGNGGVLLARINSTPLRRADLARLDRQVAKAIRAGSIEVDLDALGDGQPSSVDKVTRVLREPGRPATGLAATLIAAEGQGAVRISEEARALTNRWVAAADRVARDQASLTLERRPTAPARSCP